MSAQWLGKFEAIGPKRGRVAGDDDDAPTDPDSVFKTKHEEEEFARNITSTAHNMEFEAGRIEMHAKFVRQAAARLKESADASLRATTDATTNFSDREKMQWSEIMAATKTILTRYVGDIRKDLTKVAKGATQFQYLATKRQRQMGTPGLPHLYTILYTDNINDAWPDMGIVGFFTDKTERDAYIPLIPRRDKYVTYTPEEGRYDVSKLEEGTGVDRVVDAATGRLIAYFKGGNQAQAYARTRPGQVTVIVAAAAPQAPVIKT